MQRFLTLLPLLAALSGCGAHPLAVPRPMAPIEAAAAGPTVTHTDFDRWDQMGVGPVETITIDLHDASGDHELFLNDYVDVGGMSDLFYDQQTVPKAGWAAWKPKLQAAATTSAADARNVALAVQWIAATAAAPSTRR